jgi:hypothetical protein
LIWETLQPSVAELMGSTPGGHLTPRSVPKLGRSKSEMSSATSLAAETSDWSNTHLSPTLSGGCDGSAWRAVWLAGISLLVEASFLFLITGNLSLRIGNGFGISALGSARRVQFRRISLHFPCRPGKPRHRDEFATDWAHRHLVRACRDFPRALRQSPRKPRDSAGSWRSSPGGSEPETADFGPGRRRGPRSSLLPSWAVRFRLRFAYAIPSARVSPPSDFPRSHEALREDAGGPEPETIECPPDRARSSTIFAARARPLCPLRPVQHARRPSAVVAGMRSLHVATRPPQHRRSRCRLPQKHEQRALGPV